MRAHPEGNLTMQFGVLGPLLVSIESTEIPLTARRERVVLAALLVRANGIVGRQLLIESVWGNGCRGTPRGSCMAASRGFAGGSGQPARPRR